MHSNSFGHNCILLCTYLIQIVQTLLDRNDYGIIAYILARTGSRNHCNKVASRLTNQCEALLV